MSLRRATVVVVVVVAAGVLVAGLASLLVTRGTGRAAGARTPSQALIAQTRADTLASVAKRIYFQEVYGAPNSAAYSVISVLPGLVTGLESGDLALARRTLNHVVIRHAVHERVVLGSQTLADIGLKFVVAGQQRALRAPDGTYLGQIEISIQDVIGFVKLFHRLTGAEIAVRGRIGHFKTSLAALGRMALPASGPITVGGRRYFVSSFTRVGFGGEPLTVSILDRGG